MPFHAVFVALTAVASSMVPTSSDVPSLELIRAAYTDQVESIDSIEAQIASFDSYHASLDHQDHDGDRKESTTVVWVQRGMQINADKAVAVEGSPDLPKRSRHLFDGRDTHTVTWSGRDGTVPAYRVHSGGDNTFSGLPKPDDFLGRSLPGTDLSLVDLLSQRQATVVGVESVAGHDCVKVDFGVVGRCRYSAWFDPGNSYLPRRIRVDWQQLENATERSWEVAVTEFTTCRDPTRDNRIVPLFVTVQDHVALTRGKFADSRHQVTVTDISVNHPVADERFVVAVPPGTVVIDSRSASRPRQYVSGTASELDRIADEQRRLAAAELLRLENDGMVPLDATPHGPSLFSWFLTASVALLLAAVVLRVRHSLTH
ncbi:MAG: hypothetical protein R3C19_24415 [Planctomycetaceae bacterium]